MGSSDGFFFIESIVSNICDYFIDFLDSVSKGFCFCKYLFVFNFSTVLCLIGLKLLSGKLFVVKGVVLLNGFPRFSRGAALTGSTLFLI